MGSASLTAQLTRGWNVTLWLLGRYRRRWAKFGGE